MKKILFVILLFPMFVKAQTTVTITSPTLVTLGRNSNATLQTDSVTRASFVVGAGNAGDTAVITTSTKTSFFWNLTDTLKLTRLQFGTIGTNDTLGVTIYFNDSLYVTAGATKVVTTATALNSTNSQNTGLSVTSMNNPNIPPGNWVWIELSSIVVARKPTQLTLSLIGKLGRTQ